ncbi:MAG: acyl-CoA desaturase [Chlamydiota bacterium]|nr:acyl-CoA desaturase [Chlamydiota bacterium]
MTVSNQKKPTKIKFAKYCPDDFYPVLKRRVEHYFKTNNIPYQGNSQLFIKAILLTIAYAIIYLAIISDHFQLLGLISLFGLMGIVKGLIGFNLIHDALHGSFCSKRKINNLIGYWFDLNGTSSYIWKISHNQNHHIYTNIPGHDDDIDKAILLRLNPSDKIYWFHKFQHIYAPILYSLIGFNWVFYSDYACFFRESKKSKIKFKDVTLFLTLKLANLLMFLVLPLIFLSVPWWYIALGYTSMQICGGFTIAIIFQLAHIVDNVKYFEPDDSGKINNNWAVHEMLTTSNFAINNRFLTAMIGGLNFQIEHHLFTHISHIHYPEVSKIVKATAQEFGIPYNEQPTFLSAISSHFRTLKKLASAKLQDLTVNS